MTKWGPAIAEGICNGIINSANPFNVILIPYYKAMLIAEVTGLTLNESYHFVRHLHYKATGQQAAADDELAKCIAPLQGLTQVWNTIDDSAKVEMVSQVITEIVFGNKITKLSDKFYTAILDHAKKIGAAKPIIDNAQKLLSGTQADMMRNFVDQNFAKNKQMQVLMDKAKKLLTEDTLKELRCEASKLAKKYGLDLNDLNKQIEQACEGAKDITHIKRKFKTNGINIEMKTGHSYYRQHLKGGDLRKICSLNGIEDAVIEQALAGDTLKKILTTGYLKETFDFMGEKIEYEIKKVPGKIPGMDFISIDYYPKS
jgi:hypothetical protein